MQLVVEPVFIGPELPGEVVVAVLAGLVELRHVTTGAEGFFTLGIQHHYGNLGVVAPVVDCLLNGDTHVVAQRVQRLGPGQGDAARAPRFSDVDVTHGGLSGS